MNIKSLLLLFICLGASFLGRAQNITITSVNEHQNPQHRDQLGDYALGDTLYVKGSYPAETASSIRINLLTFKKSPWSKIDGYGFELTSGFNGLIDTFLVVPKEYTLGVNEGPEANTQMLQIAGTFSGASEFSNLYLSIIASKPERNTLLDFDLEYGVSSGQSLVSNITAAVAALQAGDTLLFNSASYDFEGIALNIEKGICLTGAFPTSGDKLQAGAYDVKTTFKNMKNFNLRANNMHLANLHLIPVETIGYVFARFSHPTQGKFYTGIRVENVIFDGGKAQCFGQDGAGITFRNVSFLNFDNIGYSCNRTYPHDELPKSTFKRCHFVPNFDKVFYNTRGISMDAGNDNHPVPWNMNGMLIDSCLFDGTGCGWSKGANAKVTNCHFIGYRGDIDMIHFEEYTNHIWVEHNLFEYSKPSRTFFIDRELQPLSDITIINNTFKGKYKFIFWGNSQFNLRFEGNDLTQASANDVNYKTFDFTAYHISSTDDVHDPLPMENLSIINNAGLNKTSIGELTINTLEGDDSNIIEDYPSGKISNNKLDFKPKPVLDTTLLYRIVNKASGEAMVAVDGSTYVQTSAEISTDSSDIWQVKFVYPYTYTFFNMKTKQYMEIYKIYTLGEYSKDPEDRPIYKVEQKSNWDGKAWKPHWLLSNLGLSGVGEFQIYPGTNERKSRVIKNGANVILDLAISNSTKELLPGNDASTWRFDAIYPVSTKDKMEDKFSVYPNPAKDVIFINHANVQEGAVVLVYDIRGALQLQQPLTSSRQSVNISSLGAGVYVVQVETAETKMRTKLIKQ